MKCLQSNVDGKIYRCSERVAERLLTLDKDSWQYAGKQAWKENGRLYLNPKTKR